MEKTKYELLDRVLVDIKPRHPCPHIILPDLRMTYPRFAPNVLVEVPPTSGEDFNTEGYVLGYRTERGHPGYVIGKAKTKLDKFIWYDGVLNDADVVYHRFESVFPV